MLTVKRKATRESSCMFLRLPEKGDGRGTAMLLVAAMCQTSNRMAERKGFQRKLEEPKVSERATNLK